MTIPITVTPPAWRGSGCAYLQPEMSESFPLGVLGEVGIESA